MSGSRSRSARIHVGLGLGLGLRLRNGPVRLPRRRDVGRARRCRCERCVGLAHVPVALRGKINERCGEAFALGLLVLREADPCYAVRLRAERRLEVREPVGVPLPRQRDGVVVVRRRVNQELLAPSADCAAGDIRDGAAARVLGVALVKVERLALDLSVPPRPELRGRRLLVAARRLHRHHRFVWVPRPASFSTRL